MSTKILATEALEGAEVVNPDGDQIGTIDKIMLDAVTGRIAYVVLTADDFLGFGGEQFVVPFSLLDFDMQVDHFVSALDKDRLEEAPRYDPEAAAPGSGYEYLDDIYVFYGVDRYWERRREPKSVESPSHPAAVPSS